MKRDALSHFGFRHARSLCAGAMVVSLALLMGRAATPIQHVCQQVTIDGEVKAGHEWSAALGEGWVFRVLPIAGADSGYSGWDLAVDREPPAGYPDALLLATLPYGSINEREIGTTFGLRAQDAIGWNPRSFRFITDRKDFREAQSIYVSVFRSPTDSTAEQRSAAMAPLMDLEKHASFGELRILDARIVPGIADPKPYAKEWALASSRTQHEIEAASPGAASAKGSFVWMRFALTLWVPPHWRLSAGLHPARVSCP